MGARRRPRSRFGRPGSPCGPVRQEEGERRPRALRAGAAEAPSRLRPRSTTNRPSRSRAREQSHEACRRVRRHVRPAVDDVRIVAMDRQRVETRDSDQHISADAARAGQPAQQPEWIRQVLDTSLTITRSNVGSSGTACSRRCRVNASSTEVSSPHASQPQSCRTSRSCPAPQP